MLFKLIRFIKELWDGKFWLIVGLFAIVATLEFLTPAAYVFGYLYIGPILLVNTRFGRIATFQATAIACLLTMANVWIPGHEVIEIPTIASRAIAVLALVVTGFLSDRNRSYQQTVLQQKAKLQAQEKLASVREDFASTLTHDLKTPMLGAIETLEALQRENFGPILPAQRVVVTTMIRSHQTSLQLVETLLDVYRNDTEGLKLQFAPVDLVEVAEDVATTLMGLAASRRIHISFNYGHSDFRQFLWVNGDAFQLHRVFVNLLTNAINHSPRGSKVEVVLEPGSSYQVAKVMDMGAGITPQELPHLFERFYQGESDRQAKGSGLGLYLTRQIVEAHGGKIWAENRQPNGAVFAFRLPVLPFQLSLST
ncbi:two-component sensor histidine kinase [Leptolyngbya sp. 'hensonii']|uniref:sensor histidine kinase n=1 Tax=Leptolyngbya sp. 'hensonii' TaxID=1922337 RepID=UPI00094F6786|nr:HAMP domain-containing sensor histidine kinase [Leptolyngbya sp. 'hensonii']OLP19196.1 two-component sensor histidine kinase [Leptolyngbya sp. 'hensonii']